VYYSWWNKKWQGKYSEKNHPRVSLSQVPHEHTWERGRCRDGKPENTAQADHMLRICFIVHFEFLFISEQVNRPQESITLARNRKMGVGGIWLPRLSPS
jgi:hypothetical protein